MDVNFVVLRFETTNMRVLCRMTYPIPMGVTMGIEIAIAQQNIKLTNKSVASILHSLASYKVSRLRLLVCATSDEQNFAPGPEDDFQGYYLHFNMQSSAIGLEICSTFEDSVTVGIGQLCIPVSNASTHTFCHIGGARTAIQTMGVDMMIVAIHIMNEICRPTQFLLQRRHLYFSYFDIETIVSVGGVRCDDGGIDFLSLSENQTWVYIYDGNRIFDNYSTFAISATIFGFETSDDCIIFSNLQTDPFTRDLSSFYEIESTTSIGGCVATTAMATTTPTTTTKQLLLADLFGGG